MTYGATLKKGKIILHVPLGRCVRMGEHDLDDKTATNLHNELGEALSELAKQGESKPITKGK